MTELKENAQRWVWDCAFSGDSQYIITGIKDIAVWIFCKIQFYNPVSIYIHDILDFKPLLGLSRFVHLPYMAVQVVSVSDWSNFSNSTSLNF